MRSITQSFQQWELSDLQDYFGLTHQINMEILDNWLNTTINLTKEEIRYLEELVKEAILRISHWNETELREKFIMMLLNKVKFDDYEQQITSFSERKIEVTIQNPVVKATLSGVVDWVVATGRFKPKHPFFFLHEYKKEKGTDNDPLAQLLAAMLAAQVLNQEKPRPTLFNQNPLSLYKELPIYGAYVLGRNWFFVVLKDNKYSVSQAFVSTKIDDLQTIFKILKAQKQLIYSYLEE